MRCSSKNTVGRSNERGKMQRNGYRTRTIVTLLGEVTLNLAVIRGRGIPLYDIVEFESGEKYQSDVKAILVDSALRMTYRDARDEINYFTLTPSTQELGVGTSVSTPIQTFRKGSKVKVHSTLTP